MQAKSKLDTLIEIEGYDSFEQMAAAILSDSVSPGICTNAGCDFVTEVEPDQDRGWCEECGTNTVKSALILACII
jgi:hypothetical protein